MKGSTVLNNVDCKDYTHYDIYYHTWAVVGISIKHVQMVGTAGDKIITEDIVENCKINNQKIRTILGLHCLQR